MIIIFPLVFVIIVISSSSSSYNAVAFPETEAASLWCLMFSKGEIYSQFCKRYCSREYLAPLCTSAAVGAENETFLKHRVRSFPQ
jgi:hypothetical protein